MATIDTITDAVSAATPVFVPPLPALEPGDHLDQPTFHARYEASPAHVRAELIEGNVYMPSPVKLPHSDAHGETLHWLFTFRDATQGTRVCVTPTVVLGPRSEPEPDACLLLDPALGGKTTIKDDYIAGPPELIVEIASSTEAIDLHAKKRDYERAGVREYLVVALRQRQVHWFSLRDGNYVNLEPSADGVLRSEMFPGLWLDAGALLARDSKRLLEVLRQGLDSAEHAAWAAKLR
jgi:Uma2 family endonuclease